MHVKRHVMFSSLLCALGGSALLYSASSQAQVTDQGSTAGPQCVASAVDDAGIEAGTCINANRVAVAFITPTPGAEQTLAPLVNGNACTAGGVNNAATATAIVVGSCIDTAGVSQAVRWSVNAPTTAPAKLNPLSVLAFTGVTAAASSLNLQGDIAGASSDGKDNTKPNIWLAGSTTATELQPPLLVDDLNCTPADLSDRIAGQPSIVGNCPKSNGLNVPVLWTTPSARYITLPLPTTPAGAQYCIAVEINVLGQILGNCNYGGDVHRAVRWAAGGTTAPIVLQTISGNAELRSSAVDMNASGQIAGNYRAANGFTLPFFWDPASGSNAVGITPIGGGNRATARAIADNGMVVGSGEVANGDIHAFHSLLGAAPTEDTPLTGGSNDTAIAISKNGCQVAGASEVAGQSSHADIESLCR